MVALLHDVCARLEPAAIDVVDVESVFDAFVAIERLAGGAVTRFAARYAQVGVWRRSGARSVEDAIGAKTGTSVTHARRQLATAKASADTDREATRRRLHRQRSLRRWNDADGMSNLLLKLPADEMAEIDASLKAPIDQIFLEARRSGRVEPSEAYAADAIISRLLGNEPAATLRRTGGAGTARKPNGASGASAGSGVRLTPVRGRSQAVRPDKKVIAVIDVEALNRGRVEGDEQCEIAGVGPVSVAAVRRLLGDAFLSIVIKGGVDIRSVTHLGRQVTAHQRTALEARGGACEFCGSTFRVEIDHIKGWALTCTTHIDDLSLKCWHCHEQKTRLGLHETGPPGNRTFHNPDGTPRARPNIPTPDIHPTQTADDFAKRVKPLHLLV